MTADPAAPKSTRTVDEILTAASDESRAALKVLGELVGNEPASVATPAQFDEWSKLWRVAVDGGSQDPLIAFMARESGLSEEQFLEKLAAALEWPFLNLKLLDIPVEARARISTKVAFQHGVMPTSFTDGVLTVVVSNDALDRDSCSARSLIGC